eukprot:COSAG02_NODE_9495_length_2198_cov_1.514054_2_plen_194_part_00
MHAGAHAADGARARHARARRRRGGSDDRGAPPRAGHIPTEYRHTFTRAHPAPRAVACLLACIATRARARAAPPRPTDTMLRLSRVAFVVAAVAYLPPCTGGPGGIIDVSITHSDALAPPLHWPRPDGAEGAPRSLATGSAGAVMVYVDCERGSDDSNGLSALHALRTLPAAQKLARQHRSNSGGVVVTVLPGV